MFICVHCQHECPRWLITERALARKVMISSVSVPPSVCSSVRFSSTLTFEPPDLWPLDCFMFMDYDQWPYSSPGIKNQGHTSRSKVKGSVSRDGSAVGLTSILDRRQFLNRVAWTQCMDADYCYRCLCVCCWSQQKAEPIEVPLGVIDSDEPKEP